MERYQGNDLSDLEWNDMEHEIIYSGETDQFEQLEQEWLDMVGNAGNKITFEEALKREAEDSPMTINELAAKFCEFPRYRYVIHFLLKYFRFTFSKEDREQLFCDIDSKKVKVKPRKQMRKEHKSERQFCFLVRKIKDTFRENHMPEEYADELYLRKMILCFDERFLLEAMAPGLGMTVEMVNIFLNKVLKRASLDYYDPEEFILALVLNCRTGILSFYEQYRQILKYYQNLEPKKNIGIGKEQEKETQELLTEQRENDESEWNGEEEFLGKTERLFRKSEKMLSDLQGQPLFQGITCDADTINEKLNKVLIAHKSVKRPAMRTAEVEYLDLLEKVCTLYQIEISDDWSVRKELAERKEKGDGVEALRREGAGYLQLVYETDRDIFLKKGMLFYRKKDKKMSDVPDNRVYFSLAEDTMLPVNDTVTDVISVKSVTKRPPECNRKNKFLKAATLEASGGMIEMEEKAGSQLLDIEPFSGVSFFETESDHGKMKIRCRRGTVIPKGTVFFYRDAERTYRFVTTEEYRTPKNPSREVKVTACSFHEATRIRWEKQCRTEKYRVLADSGSICYMEEPVKEIQSVQNRRPICYQETTKEALSIQEGSRGYQDKKRISFDNFKKYLYTSSELEDEIETINPKLFGRWFFLTKLDYDSVKNFSAKSSEEQRANILTLIFLKFVKEKIENNSGWNKNDKKSEKRRILNLRNSFEEQVDLVMNRCRLQRLYLGNSYDCLLVYLLASDYPGILLQSIWGAVTKSRRRKQGGGENHD